MKKLVSFLLAALMLFSLAACTSDDAPEIKKWLVTGANEEGCIGAVRALESMGLDGDACVVGLGAYMAKDEWNDKGADGTCMKASACFSSDSEGFLIIFRYLISLCRHWCNPSLQIL